MCECFLVTEVEAQQNAKANKAMGQRVQNVRLPEKAGWYFWPTENPVGPFASYETATMMAVYELAEISELGALWNAPSPANFG